MQRETVPSSPHRDFRRDERRKLLAGVVAGLQNRFLPQVDLTVMRVAVLVLSLLTGAAPFLALGYALLWVLAPAE
ncbi:MAG: PspC domain-containing protein [Deinococcus sp.]|nr:PspC domain-containing protein [Deinococcus sp.]